MQQNFKLAIVVLVFILLGAVVYVLNVTNHKRLAEFSWFTNRFNIEQVGSFLIRESSGENQCTRLTDEAPFRHSIDQALSFIQTKVDREFYDEASRYLTRGVRYAALEIDKAFPYSAYYVNKRIHLYPILFEYGCLEDIVSTLIHEMVHAVQHGRYKLPGRQAWEHSLKGNSLDKVIAEIEADAYQLYVSGYLHLLSENHLRRVMAVRNNRIAQYHALKAMRSPSMSENEG